MIVDVHLFATLRRNRFSRRGVDLPPGARIGDLLERLQIPIEEAGIVIVNQRDATLNTELTEGDRVTLMPHIGGG